MRAWRAPILAKASILVRAAACRECQGPVACRECREDRAVVKVQYKDADEWYAVQGGSTHLADKADLDAVHVVAVGLLNRPDG